MNQLLVLKYVSRSGDYEVLVRTDSIDYAWKNFKGRIRYRNQMVEDGSDPEAYCHYEGSESDIYLLDSTEKLDASRLHRPVVFETNKYNIKIKFHGVDPSSSPKIIHINKEVERAFFPDHEADPSEMSLEGTMDFVNKPGFFRLEFCYKKDGREKRAFVAFDVVSPKLDTKHDYQRILRDVNQEFEGLVFDYLSTTFQQVDRGKEKGLEIWMQIFQQVAKTYLKYVDYVIKSPFSKVKTKMLYSKADRISHWTAAMEEEYMEAKYRGEAESHYFGHKEYDNTVDTMENRFVKYTLESIGGKLAEVFDKLLNGNKDVSETYRTEWQGYQHKIQRLQKHPFFKNVGRFEGLTHESLVLQNGMGYQQVYKSWLKLKRGIDFFNGLSNIGTLQIWEIYELWCFIKMKRMVRNLLGFDPEKPDSDYGNLIAEPNGPLIHYDKKNKDDYHVKFRYPNPNEVDVPESFAHKDDLLRHKGDVVTLHYQHVFNRKNPDDFKIHTLTTEQRPDIVMNIHQADIMLTYLYDAKYRVWSDKKLDNELEEQDVEEMNAIVDEENMGLAENDKLQGADYPPSDAINQMHRYRDAIYYGMNKEDRPESKEIIGGYILFPGRGDDKHIKDRYFYKSIEKVNIGALPLLPKDGGYDEQGRDVECPQLWEHLEEVLLKKESTFAHVGESVPQRGLVYADEASSSGQYLLSSIDTHVNIADEILAGTATKFVSGYATVLAGIDFKKVKYLAPVNDHLVAGYYKVKEAKVADMSTVLKVTQKKNLAKGKTDTYDGYDKPFRIVLEIEEYKQLDKPFNYGINQNAAKGVTLTRKNFYDFIRKESAKEETN
ncbi:MAG: restriction endonuclease-like protein [Bacteroidales bacterium]|nr:restriction endonuclease-like protein [Bacteroidales bacterium]